MRKRYWCILGAVVLLHAGVLHAEMIGNPGFQIGKKNLFVGLEYTTLRHTFDLDTSDLETTSERAALKVTTGLTDRLDLFLKVGGSDMTLKYTENNYVQNGLGYAAKNYHSDMNVGFGGGMRYQFMHFEDSETRLFLQGGGYYFESEGTIEWRPDTASTMVKERGMKWADMYGAVGVAKRMDIIDLHGGFGLSQVKWWINDVDITRVGTAETRFVRPERDSFESTSPFFGFVGLDFILPLEYRISIQATARNMDDAEFSIAISQGLERD